MVEQFSLKYVAVDFAAVRTNYHMPTQGSSSAKKVLSLKMTIIIHCRHHSNYDNVSQSAYCKFNLLIVENHRLEKTKQLDNHV